MSKATSTPDFGRFVSAASPENAQQNLIWSSQGEGGTGKTHFLLTAPDPIGVFLFDPAGLKGLMQNPLFRTKDIRVIDYSKLVNPGKLALEDRPKAAADILEQFQEDWSAALGAFKTVGWDKEEPVWEMLRYAQLGGVSDKPANYYELNMQYRGWFTEAEAAGVNFGVIRGMKENWGKTGVNRNTGQPTIGALGTFSPRGMKEVQELVQINLSHDWNDESKEFQTTILQKCRVGNAKALLGETFDDLDFDTLHALIYG